jgi:hypothetical protein
LKIVKLFLGQGKEGDCWDFKQEWHEEMPELIKDIICFTNTVHDENSYLIFGVNDDCEVVGMIKPRRKQADIVEAISNLVFAGDNYPKISLETIILDGKEVDVLTIFNTNMTPIYLKRTYGKMREGCIYIRNGDKNTPDNSNADIVDIEMLWKKRLGLTKPPLNYIYDHLTNPLEWKSQGNTYYNTFKPEYTLTEVDDEECYGSDEFYSYAMYNEGTIFSMLEMKCHETILDQYQLVILDSGRYKTPVPEWGFIGYDELKLNHKYSYKYYILGSDLYCVHQFYYDGNDEEQRIAHDRLLEVIIIYNSKEERLAFEAFIEENQALLDSALANVNRYNHINTGDEHKTEHYIQQLHTGILLNRLLNEYRINRQSRE